MEMLNWIWSILLIAFFTKLLYAFRAARRYKKEMEKAIDEQNKIQEEIQKKVEPVEMVKDALSGVDIPRHQAYQVVIDDKVYFFISWENRQLFIQNMRTS